MRKVRLILYSIVIIAIIHAFWAIKSGSLGIDVSHYNRNIELSELKQNENISFVIIKASEGKSFKDPMRWKYYKDAKSNNLKVGMYHFYNDTYSAEEQFNNFKESTSGMNLDILPVIDFEPKGFSNSISKEKRIKQLQS